MILFHSHTNVFLFLIQIFWEYWKATLVIYFTCTIFDVNFFNSPQIIQIFIKIWFARNYYIHAIWEKFVKLINLSFFLIKLCLFLWQQWNNQQIFLEFRHGGKRWEEVFPGGPTVVGHLTFWLHNVLCQCWALYLE